MSTRNLIAIVGTALIMTTALGPAATASAGPQGACADLGGTVDAKQICHAHTEGAGYTITLTFPVDYPDQQTLSTYLAQRRDEFIAFVEQKPPRDHAYELDAHADAYGSPASGTKSLVFAQHSESGGAHPVTSFHAFNYDLRKGAPITFDTLFKSGTNPVEVLDPIVARAMEKHWEGYEGPAPGNTLGAKVYQDFALTDDAVIFFIGQGMWLPEVAGPQRISVPRAQLASILT
jgi:hypothetical protein